MTNHEMPAQAHSVRRPQSLLRQVLSMLSLEFLLGVGASIIGLPNTVAGVAQVTTIVLIALHTLLAIGIVVVAILLTLNARDSQLARSTTVGLIAVGVTFLAGVGTLATGSGWFSFIMAAGFLVAAVSYVVAYVQTVGR